MTQHDKLNIEHY